MKGKIELQNAITIGGRETKEIEYDTDAITADLTIKACALATQESMRLGSITGAAIVFDYPTQIMLGFAAAEAVNPDADMLTLKNHVRGADVMKFMEVGANFTRSSGEEEENGQENPTSENA